MATELMARAQIMSTSMAMPTGALKTSTSGLVRAVGLRSSVSSQGLFLKSRSASTSTARRSVTRSVLEAPRVEQSATEAGALNPAEVLIQKLGAMGAPNDTELHKMSDLADRLFLWDDVPKLATKQTFTVYELNEFDRDSPAFLELSRQSVNKIDPETGAHIKALGDQVPFTNKLYDPTLTMRLGITTGICLHMKNYPGRGAPELQQLQFFTPDHYETIMSWYFGDMGHICGMGPFINFQDTLMGITGGSGFFAEARGVVRLHPITPFKFMYTFTISGIPELPKFLLNPLVPPHFGVESHPDALQCKNALPNYTD
uniref:allene-oxide cyclase n=1 Tax=Pohlia nutans TaxID=140635 RepID=A0A4P8JJ42_9BRYO|nr:allene oxide cyclase [Pohlia nutans]